MNAVYESAIGPVYVGAIQGDRGEQQDAVRVRWLDSDQAWLVVLADGMGGHAAGGSASKLAVDSFVAAFASLRQANTEYSEAFVRAVEEANSLIHSVQVSRPQTAGMGTTLVAAHIACNELRWVSVGDSPLWLIRDSTARRLNADHSLRNLNPTVRGHASANSLTSALVGEKIKSIDVHSEAVRLRSGDLILVASDGALTLSEEEIAAILTSQPATESNVPAENLLAAVEKVNHKHQDNCTVAIFSPAENTKWRAPARLVFALIALAIIAGVIALIRWFHFS